MEHESTKLKTIFRPCQTHSSFGKMAELPGGGCKGEASAVCRCQAASASGPVSQWVSEAGHQPSAHSPRTCDLSSRGGPGPPLCNGRRRSLSSASSAGHISRIMQGAPCDGSLSSKRAPKIPLVEIGAETSSRYKCQPSQPAVWLQTEG